MRLEILLMWSGLLSGCYSPNPPLGIPCSSSQECPDGQECDLLTNVCGFPTEARTMRDDTATDFEGGALTGAWIESGGFVGPVPYFVQGVLATGVAGFQLDDITTTFESLAQMTPTGRGVLRGMNINLGDGVPPLLGLASGDNITVLLEGEIFLDTPGDYVFEFRANDTGFFDIAAPGGAFQRVGAAGMMEMDFDYNAPVAGWYRLRGAVADDSQFMEWELRYQPPGTTVDRSIPDDVVRARVDGLNGAIVDTWDEPWLSLFVGTGLADKLDGVVFSGEPYAFPTGSGGYTVRWNAQFLVDVEGDYSFRLDTSHGQRAWIDGTQIVNALNGSAQVTTTPAMFLEAGWHDLAIDMIKTGGPNGRSSFTVASGPQFAGGGIPADHLRPVSGRAVRFDTSTNDAGLDLVDGGTVTRSVSMDLPAGITTRFIDSMFFVSHVLLEQVSVTLDPAVGSNVALLAPGDVTGPGDHTQHDVISNTRAGGQYSFIVGDATVDTMIGAVEFVNVTTTYSGGRAPYEPSASYTSTIRDLDAARFGALTWQMRQAQVAPIVSVRTCDEMAECDAEPWTAVANGETPTAPARKYFQYKVDITSSVDVPASLDWIDLQYVGYIIP